MKNFHASLHFTKPQNFSALAGPAESRSPTAYPKVDEKRLLPAKVERRDTSSGGALNLDRASFPKQIYSRPFPRIR